MSPCCLTWQGEFNALAGELARAYPDKARCCFSYDEPLSHLIYAGADILLVPSIFEPCGLTQMIAMRWAPLHPLARAALCMPGTPPPDAAGGRQANVPPVLCQGSCWSRLRTDHRLEHQHTTEICAAELMCGRADCADRHVVTSRGLA